MWGSNFHKRLGLGIDDTAWTYDMPMTVMKDVKKVSLGASHVVAVMEDGSLKTWGNGRLLGSGTTSDRSIAEAGTIMTGVTDAVVNEYTDSWDLDGANSAAITKEGSLYMWGDNEYGELGSDKKETILTPKMILGGTNDRKKVTFDGGLNAKEGHKRSMEIDWSMSYFEEDSRNQNKIKQKKLSIASLVLSANANNESSNLLQETLKTMGFSDIKPKYYDGEKYDGLNRVAFVLARATPYINGQKTNVIAVVCRGTVGPKDTLSDILVEANGFRTAEEYVTPELKKYMEKPEIDKSLPTKFYITGHSRGGAVANILGTDLEEYTDKGNVFVYTFACPNTTTDKSRTEKYLHIKNYIAPEDDWVARNPMMFDSKKLLNNVWQKFGVCYEIKKHTDLGENKRSVEIAFVNITDGVELRNLDDDDLWKSIPEKSYPKNMRYHTPAF